MEAEERQERKGEGKQEKNNPQETDVEGAEMADEREEMDFNELLEDGKPAGKKMLKGKKRCMMVKPIRKEVQVAAE